MPLGWKWEVVDGARVGGGVLMGLVVGRAEAGSQP
jgi:hypothetical protein